MTRNKTKLTVEEVTRDLCTLLTPGGSPNDTVSSATVMPFVASQESLIGKRICHKWKHSDGTEQYCYGTILNNSKRLTPRSLWDLEAQRP